MRRTLLILSILVVMPGFAWCGQSGSTSQKQEQLQPPQSAPKREAAPQAVEGQLTKVDAQKQLFWIKTLDGKEIQFSYTKETVVESNTGTVEGLATMNGTQLKIQFKSDGGVNIALWIEVQTVASK